MKIFLKDKELLYEISNCVDDSTMQLCRIQHPPLSQPLISSSVSVVTCTLSPYALQIQNPIIIVYAIQQVFSFLNLKIYIN